MREFLMSSTWRIKCWFAGIVFKGLFLFQKIYSMEAKNNLNNSTNNPDLIQIYNISKHFSMCLTLHMKSTTRTC